MCTGIYWEETTDGRLRILEVDYVGGWYACRQSLMTAEQLRARGDVVLMALARRTRKLNSPSHDPDPDAEWYEVETQMFDTTSSHAAYRYLGGDRIAWTIICDANPRLREARIHP
jgi:hypothetical protein